MYDLTIPTFTYAGAMLPAKRRSKAREIALAFCAGLLVAALAI